MPADDIAIRASHLSKVYRMYKRPFDRLRQWLSPNGKKYYREFAALDDVSFEIRKGETVGIIGHVIGPPSDMKKIIFPMKILPVSPFDVALPHTRFNLLFFTLTLWQTGGFQ